MGIFANSEDPDEMAQNAAFHPGHCSLYTKLIFRERNATSDSVSEIIFRKSKFWKKSADDNKGMTFIYQN